MRWQDCLTKAQLKHLRESGCHTLESVKRTRKTQIKQRLDYPDAPEPCWECKWIAGDLYIAGKLDVSLTK